MGRRPDAHESVKAISQTLFSKMIYSGFTYDVKRFFTKNWLGFLGSPNSLTSSRRVLNNVHLFEAGSRNATTSEHHVFRDRLVCEWV